MNYEALDWELEAQRVARAFGVKQPVQFAPMYVDDPVFKCLFTIADEPQLYIPISSVLSLEVSYHSTAQFPRGMKYFQVHRSGTMIEGHSSYSARIQMNWDGSLTDSFLQLQHDIKSFGRPWYYHRFAVPLAKGLLHLGLLTPEIEEVLLFDVSRHQKMEWSLEYEERNEL